MSTSKNGNQPTQGKCGVISYYLRRGEVIARPAHNMRSRMGRTAANMSSRTKMANLNACWRQLKPWLQECFELPKPSASDYSEFMSLNLRRTEVRLSKEEAGAQTAVADHFVVSHGTLPFSVQTELKEGHIVSDLRVGELPGGWDTGMMEFVTALAKHNPGRVEEYDELLFLRLRQTGTGEGETPRVLCTRTLVELDPLHRVSLRHVLEGQDWQEGFALRGGCLAQPAREGELVAWVVRRPRRGARPLVSSQQLAGSNPLLASYTDPEHAEEAILSYGPLERKVL